MKQCRKNNMIGHERYIFYVKTMSHDGQVGKVLAVGWIVMLDDSTEKGAMIRNCKNGVY